MEIVEIIGSTLHLVSGAVGVVAAVMHLRLARRLLAKNKNTTK
jgi:hypothetical protein